MKTYFDNVNDFIYEVNNTLDNYNLKLTKDVDNEYYYVVNTRAINDNTLASIIAYGNIVNVWNQLCDTIFE